jgi:hypothetical protein
VECGPAMGCGEGWVRVAVVRAGEVGDLAEGACGGQRGGEQDEMVDDRSFT